MNEVWRNRLRRLGRGFAVSFVIGDALLWENPSLAGQGGGSEPGSEALYVPGDASGQRSDSSNSFIGPSIGG